MSDGGGDRASLPVVLLAAETSFMGDYVAGVLKARGMSVIGPLGDMPRATQILSTAEIRAVILVHAYVERDRRRLVEILVRRGLPYLLLMDTGRTEGDEDGAVLVRPFAAYQVADWVAKQI